MSDDLRVRFAKFEADKKLKEQRPSAPWSPEAWEATRKAYMSGWRPLDEPHPVVISPNSLVTSPERLQELLHLETTPKAYKTTTTELGDPGEDFQPQEVEICEIKKWQAWSFQHKTEGERFTVWFHGEKRFAWMAVAFGRKDRQQWWLDNETN